eukprot:scaffold6274_cov132-Isochrysis_galbana.AAC.3
MYYVADIIAFLPSTTTKPHNSNRTHPPKTHRVDPGSGTNPTKTQAQTPRGVTVGTLKRGPRYKTPRARGGSRWRPAALVPSRQRRTRPWTSVPNGPALWAKMRARHRYDCERERARASCKPACTIIAHILAWLLR